MNRQSLRRAAIPVAVVLCAVSLIWPQIQGVATILLLLVTFEYVLLTQENIELFRRQLERQERVYLDFGLSCQNGPLSIRVTNLGISNFLISGIQVRTQDRAKFHYSAQEIVESGKSEELGLPREACAGYAVSVDLEITLEYLGLDVRGKSNPKCFNVGMAEDNIPNTVKSGLDGLWSMTCPRCHQVFAGLSAMSLRGLSTFNEAFARKELVLEDFRNSCPNHGSKWVVQMAEEQE